MTQASPLPAPKPLPAANTPFFTPTTPGPLAGAGQFVVLKDEKMVEGKVTMTADKVLVRQGALDRPFPKDQVQFIGSTRDEVYKYMVGRVDAGDPAGRLKVAKWCMFNGMREHALSEAREVARLQPSNTAAAEMIKTLEESLKLFPTSGTVPTATTPSTPPPLAVPQPAPTPPPLPGTGTAPPLPATPPPASKPAPPVIPPAIPEAMADLGPEAVAAFTTRVQPILANLCADCHGKPDHAGSFRLARTTAYDPGPQTSRQNLHAVASQLKKDDPANSPLLRLAITAHGGMKQPPLAHKQVPAFRTLEAWVFAAVGTPPTLPAPPEVAVKPAAATTPTTEPAATPPLPLPMTVTASPLPTPPKPSALPPVTPTATTAFGQDAKPLPPPSAPSPVSTTPEPADEFDPAVFNKAVHPAGPPMK